MTLVVHYPPAYPEELPELKLSHDDPNMDVGDGEKLISELLKVVSILLPSVRGVIRNIPVGNGKPGDGDDFYSSDTFTRTDRYIDTKQDRLTEENRCRERATSDRSMFRLNYYQA